MKTDKQPIELEQLLADVEHAGRDARRRDELSAMIDSMAAAESGERKHGFWWWGARVAAAACIFFFITTAVRVWFIPTGNNATLVAEADVPAAVQTVDIDSAVASPAAPRPAARQERRRVVQPTVLPAEEPVLVAEEVPAEPVEPTPLPYEEAAMEPHDEYASTVDEIAAPVVSVGNDESVAVAMAEPAKVEPAQEQPHRRSIFGNFFRQPEPDDMTGTVLAFRIL